ncbi:MAG: DNA-binding protein [Massilia sp.]|nr:MAG: DNA-binding protein [Massilia sp.]
MNLDDLTDDVQLAAALGCELSTIQARALAGELPGLKFGRGWVFPRSAVLDALNRQALLQAEARTVGKACAPVAVSVTPKHAKAKRALPVLPALSDASAPR